MVDRTKDGPLLNEPSTQLQRVFEIVYRRPMTPKEKKYLAMAEALIDDTPELESRHGSFSRPVSPLGRPAS